MHDTKSTEHDETYAATGPCVLKGEKDRFIFISLALDAVSAAETIR